MIINMKSSVVILMLATIVQFSCGEQPEKDKLSNNKHTEELVEVEKARSLEDLSLREKIGQTMMMKINVPKEIEIGEGSYKKYFEKYPVGGFFMANWIIRNYVSEDSIADFIKERIKIYNANCRVPMLYQEDYEAGAGVGVNGYARLTSLMGVGATNDTTLAYQYGNSISKQVRDLGINWLLHPVADLDLNPLNSLVSIRSASDNPDKVIKIIRSQIQAMKDNGVAATIKHFPGDGVDYRDQHMVTTENNLSMDEWWKTYGKVFQIIIDEGVSSIMLGHIRLTNYQKEKVNGELPPATLSKELIDLLKNDMKFDGVVLSDALDMGGFMQYYPSDVESQVACFEAGCDMLLWPDEVYMDSVEAKIMRKEIPMARLDDAVKRVWALKKKLGVLDEKYEIFKPMSQEEKEYIEKTATELAEKSITMVSNRSNILPLKKVEGKKIRFSIVVPTALSAIENENIMTTVKELSARGFVVDTVFNTFNKSASEEYSHYIYAFVRVPFSPFSSKLLQDHEGFAVWAISKLPLDKVITISYGDPYVHKRYFERVGASVNAYSSSKSSQIATVRALCGEIPFNGVSPVEMKDLR